MTAPNQNIAGAQDYMAEKANEAASARWAEVMGSDAAKGREKLAIQLLSLNGPHMMLPGEIIATLEKAPAPGASAGTPAAPAIEPQADPAEAPSASSWWNEKQFLAGEASAKLLLGK